ncbi:SDR family oxidoreductase [Pseudonocardia halophobica]|uniref:Short chain dehydrogenase n=1 Tax=Pseudonocardia halophobica TaxID=29401 RepID=A0A9W6L2I1_9PSEU|nr:glucose 1-dehydrogenase [Pseudonocardia halophobica]GLL09864.1 short chain dehydrogenase [Pseudonocardia halophobica]
MTDRFRGKVAIVTGASAGIGRAVALALAAEGARVVVNALDPVGLEKLGTEADLVAVVGDTAEEDTADRLVAAALDTGGRVDLLVNNAGVHRSVPTAEFSSAEWRRVIDINLNGYFYLARAAGAVMIRQRAGVILNVASTAGVAAALNSAAYVASKHGVVGLTKALAVDWARYGIRVNALGPGLTTTGMVQAFAESAPDLYAARERRVPLGRAASPEEQAATALFLLSDESAYTSGQILVVDGGGAALYSGYEAPAQER